MRGCEIPLNPSHYVSGPVSPQQLNTDLYGIPGQPSGVLFHATRPLLSETVTKGGTAYAALSINTVAGKGPAAYTVIDTTALAGTGADRPGTYSTFTFTNTVPATSGVSRRVQRPVAHLELPAPRPRHRSARRGRRGDLAERRLGIPRNLPVR